MLEGPDISKVAALIGDPARSNMLLSLMDGRALTASELANAAGVTKQTASSHLSRLLQGGLVAREVQGRHHYYRLHDHDIANVIEALLNVSGNGSGVRTRTGPRDSALRRARICYDHLAGELGVHMFDRMKALSWIGEHDGDLCFTNDGWIGLKPIGLTKDALKKSRRPECKSCLDWSMRRHHLAGKIGALVFERLLEKKWAKRVSETRIVQFSKPGEAAFQQWLA